MRNNCSASRSRLTEWRSPVSRSICSRRRPRGSRAGIENPSMVAGAGADWLVYSGAYWATGRYAMGYARCAGPLGPCREMSAGGPWVSTTGDVVGPGGGAVFGGPDGQLRLAYHAWSGGTGLRRRRPPVAAHRDHRRWIERPVDPRSGSEWRGVAPRDRTGRRVRQRLRRRSRHDTDAVGIDRVPRRPGKRNRRPPSRLRC